MAAAPLVRDKKTLAFFWAVAVGQDVDHYLWYVWRFRDPSLRRAYQYFRSRYPGTGRKKGQQSENRFLHGPLPLLTVGAASLKFRWLRPVAAAMAFHALLDVVNEYVLLPRVRARSGIETGTPLTESPPELAGSRSSA